MDEVRWIDVTRPRKTRKPGKRRFENIKVGDFVMKDHISRGWRGGKDDPSKPAVDLSKTREYALVTDLWFDPVRGEENPQHGEMVAITPIMYGKPFRGKAAHSIRGLAANGYLYADRDPVAEYEAVVEAAQDGKVVGIGMGRLFRMRPKTPGSHNL